jgi:capsular polysaccharide export protein
VTIGILSRGILRIPHLASLVGEEVAWCPPLPVRRGLRAIAGWGLRPTAARARRYAERRGLPYLSLEDGFLRSHGLGASGAPPLSLIVDDLGVYYDATRPSRLEVILNRLELSAGRLAEAGQVLAVLRREGLSKYNHASDVPEGLFGDADRPRVLVVDQTAGDVSIRYGLAGAESFSRMLRAAREENPDADVYVKTHPDVLAGKKRGCLDASSAPAGVRWLAEDWHPPSLLRHFDRVYVVTSQMGFDALSIGKPVTCFGMPFYAGWGLTDDRVDCPRRISRRSLLELVAAAYLEYPRYLKPETGESGTFFDLAEFIGRQRRMARSLQGRVFCFGFKYWKRAHVRPFFGSAARPVFVRSAAVALAKGAGPGDSFAVWGQTDTPDVEELAGSLGSPLWRVEDGFVRSVGLGSDFVPPYSLAFDRRGIYFDPSRESDLEHLLGQAAIPSDLLARACRVRTRIQALGITKYNTEPVMAAAPRRGGSTRRPGPGPGGGGCLGRQGRRGGAHQRGLAARGPGALSRRVPGLQASSGRDGLEPARLVAGSAAAGALRPCGDPQQRPELHRGRGRGPHHDLAGGLRCVASRSQSRNLWLTLLRGLGSNG